MEDFLLPDADRNLLQFLESALAGLGVQLQTSCISE